MKLSNIHPTSIIYENVFIDNKAQVGPNCYLQGQITIEPDVILQGGVTLIGDIEVGSHSVIEPGVCIASSRLAQESESSVVRVGHYVHIGAGSVLLSGISIGHHAWIEPGTIVQRNIPPHAIVGGNPATIRGYLDIQTKHQDSTTSSVITQTDASGVSFSFVQGVTIHQFSKIRDLRGDLSVGEFERNVPFLPKRYFIVYDVPSMETRGEHAHKKCHQFLICVAGSVSVVVDDGSRREEVLLDRPNIGLYIPAGVWGIQYKYSGNGTLLVFASEYYDASDYIRNYDDFLKYRGVSL